MKSAGWVAVPEAYEDGGYSGGTTERPALKRLFADIEAGKVDAVVVVKIDRLSRSLLQFLQMMEFFEENGTAFVAVTQSLDSSTSAGRLMIGVLMSFAQFERELGSERSREKSHAARKKGRYIGGCPPMGFDVDREKHCLVVNPQEAEMVRELFNLYLTHRSLISVVEIVNARGWTKKRWSREQGSLLGGPFDKVYLQRLLTNVRAIGKVTLLDEIYPGQHSAIVDEEVFNQVQLLLIANRNGQGNAKPCQHDALLRGIIRCGSCGCTMGHHYTRKAGGKLYTYYRCVNEVKRGRRSCPTTALPAGEIEAFVVDQIRRVARDPELTRQVFAEAVDLQGQQIETLKSEQQHLQKQKIQRDEETRRLVSSIGVSDTTHESVISRLTENESGTATITQRLAEIRDELERLGEGRISLEGVMTALHEFDALWDVLVPKERERVIHSVIERVDCSPDKEIRVVFQTSFAGMLTTPPPVDEKGDVHAAPSSTTVCL
jgi:site-specific DNA recombinase